MEIPEVERLKRATIGGVGTDDLKGMVGTLLDQSGDQHRGFETNFHDSNATKLPSPLFALAFDERPEIPRGRWQLAETNENPVFLCQRRRGRHRLDTADAFDKS